MSRHGGLATLAGVSEVGIFHPSVCRVSLADGLGMGSRWSEVSGLLSGRPGPAGVQESRRQESAVSAMRWTQKMSENVRASGVGASTGDAVGVSASSAGTEARRGLMRFGGQSLDRPSWSIPDPPRGREIEVPVGLGAAAGAHAEHFGADAGAEVRRACAEGGHRLGRLLDLAAVPRLDSFVAECTFGRPGAAG